MTATETDVVRVEIHHACISHKHGQEFYMAGSRTGLDAQIAQYCRDRLRHTPGIVPNSTDPDALADDTVINLYFCHEMDHEETLETGCNIVTAVPLTEPPTQPRAKNRNADQPWVATIMIDGWESPDVALFETEAEGLAHVAALCRESMDHLPTKDGEAIDVFFDRKSGTWSVSQMPIAGAGGVNDGNGSETEYSEDASRPQIRRIETSPLRATINLAALEHDNNTPPGEIDVVVSGRIGAPKSRMNRKANAIRRAIYDALRAAGHKVENDPAYDERVSGQASLKKRARTATSR
jgi:hypothetical protein